MKRIIFGIICSVIILSFATFLSAEPLARDQREATFRYILSLQNDDGGFRAAAAPGPSLLSATSSAIRALKNLGGPIDTRPEKTVLTCLDSSGGFSDTPGGKPEVRFTWMGVNALVNMKGGPPPQMDKIWKFVAANAKSLYPDIYFATSIVEDTKIKPPQRAAWLAAMDATLKPGGTYGKNVDDLAHTVVIILRLGGKLKDRPQVAKALKAAQGPEGSFSGNGKDYDMPGTYTVMRALWMMYEKPNLEAVKKFVASCRNADGGYGVSPGKPSSVTPTYMASSVLRWADEMTK